MKTLRNSVKILLALIITFVLLMFLISFLPIGTGSESYAKEWTENFESIKDLNQAIEKYPGIDYKKFENGDWIIGVSSDSHYNPWGGTVVTKDSNGTIKSLFGHVCGPNFFQMVFPRAESPDGVYKILSKGFTEYKPDKKK